VEGQGSRTNLLWNLIILRIADIILGKRKALQVEEDKALTEYIVFVIAQKMSPNGKYICGGIGYPIGLSQSKGISSKPGGRGLGERKTLSHSEGVGSGMLMK
jgi:hypothetical protein